MFDENVRKGASLDLDEIELTPLVKEILRASQVISARLGQTFVGTEHVMLALLASNGSAALTMLERGFNINIDNLKADVLNALRNESYDSSADSEATEKQNEGSTLPKNLLELGTDLTLKARQKKIDPVIGREEEIARVIEILCRKTKNNPVLIGEAGVGRSGCW